MPGGRDLRIPTSAKGGPRSLKEWRATHTHTRTRVPGHLDLEDRLMRYYLSTPCEDQQDTARSGGLAGTCLRRRSWGFSQNMPVSYKSNRQFNLNTRPLIVNRGRYIGNGVNIPACSTKEFDPIPGGLKQYLFFPDGNRTSCSEEVLGRTGPELLFPEHCIF